MLYPGQPRQHSQALRNDVLVRRKRIPGQRLPFNEMFDRELAAGEEADLCLELVRVLRVFGQDKHRTIRGARQFGGGQREAGANQSAPLGGLAGGWQRRLCRQDKGRVHNLARQKTGRDYCTAAHKKGDGAALRPPVISRCSRLALAYGVNNFVVLEINDEIRVFPARDRGVANGRLDGRGSAVLGFDAGLRHATRRTTVIAECRPALHIQRVGAGRAPGCKQQGEQ